MSGIVGILLAAGIGSRFGSDKLLYRLPCGTPIAVAAANNLRPTCDRMVAVVRPNHWELAFLLAAAGCEITPCYEAEGGMGHSLATGVQATSGASGWIVALADMPFITSASHQAVASQLRDGASLVATQYQDRRGHPVGFSREWYLQLLAMHGDEGGRAILEKHREKLILCPVNDPGVVLDIDCREDLKTLGSTYEPGEAPPS